MMALSPYIAAVVAAPVTLVASGPVRLTSPVIRVADVVAVPAALPAARRNLVIARLPRRTGQVTLSRAALASLVRRGLPGLAVVEPAPAGAVAFLLPRVAPPTARAAVSTLPAPRITRGQTLQLSSRVGPVRIVRPVTALQTSRGKRVFVRDPDGTVFSVRVGAEDSAR